MPVGPRLDLDVAVRPAAPARACRRSRARVPPWSKLKPPPSSATRELDAGRPRGRADVDVLAPASAEPRWRAPPGRPGRRRAGRRPGARRARPRLERRARCRPARRARATCPASAAFRPRSSSAVGRSWRASVQQLLHRLVGERLRSRRARRRAPGGAFSRAASSRSSKPVSDWLTSSWRSRATRARSSSWASSAALEVRRRSASSRSSMRANAWCRRSTSSGPPARSRRPQVGAGRREVGALHLVDEALQRPEAALQQEDVEEDRQRDREARATIAGLRRVASVDARGSPRSRRRRPRRRSAAG